jgi:MFS family permease
LPASLRALSYRNYRLFFFGQLISLIGTWMQSTAQQWLVYRLTDSQAKLGTVTFLGFIPVLFLSLFMGVIVDRFERRRILIFTQSWFALLALILAALTFTGIVEYWHILVLAFLLGIANSLDMPARQSLYVDLVPKGDLLNAISLNSSIINAGRIVGPAIAGWLIAQLGEAPAFLVNGISYLAVITALIMMRMPPFQGSDLGSKSWQSLKNGLRYLVGERRIFGLVSLLAAFSMFGFAYLVLLPVFARDVLQIGVEGYGTLMTAQGIGALIAALTLATYGDRVPKGKILTLGRFGLAFAVAILGVSRQPWLSAIAITLAGISLVAQFTVTNTLIQLIVPDDMRGRVMSAFSWSIGGFYPLGALLIGNLGDALGAPTVVLISAAMTAGLAALGAILFRETWRL